MERMLVTWVYLSFRVRNRDRDRTGQFIKAGNKETKKQGENRTLAQEYRKKGRQERDSSGVSVSVSDRAMR
jgi:hypothetical protein